MPLIPEATDDPQVMTDVLQIYEDHFPKVMTERWCAKIGLRPLPVSISTDLAVDATEDQRLALDWLTLLAKGRVDFTIAFRRLAEFRSDLSPEAPGNARVRDLFLDREAFDAWAGRYIQRLKAESSVDAERAVRMNLVNPLYVLRNHMAETAIRQAQQGDDSEVQRLQRLLQRPFDEQAGCEADADFPPNWAQSIEVSCSS